MTRAAAPKIVCAGMAVLDQVFRVERFPAANVKARASAFFSVVGGCAANAAIAIARLGGHAKLAGVLGAPSDDEIGDRILSGLAREGIDCRSTVRMAGTTSTISSILVDAAGDRMIATHCDQRLFTAAVGDPRALVRGADAVLVDNWLPHLVVPICAAARQRALPVIVDGDGPIPESSELLMLATHLIFSAEALRATAARDDLGEALARIAERVPGFVAVTDGANDMLWLDGNALHRLPAFPVVATDTLAAGDVFHGAFALALAEGRREPDALRFAAASAAIKCTRCGGGQGAPDRAEVEAFMSQLPDAGIPPEVE